MTTFQILALGAALAAPCLHTEPPATDPWAAFRTAAAERFGREGERAAAFLEAHRPEADLAIDPELLLEHLDFALRARREFIWARKLDEELFFNDVLPYAVLDETRERWRPQVFALASTIVADAESAAEAIQALNRELFSKTSVRYSTARKRPSQSALESIESGLASCTGLSILLVKACRSVGIPARVAGIASWPGRGGNHTWVEIWDGERWRFTGAAEHDEGGLDRAWFTAQASRAIEGHELHAIWASSWQATGRHFPLAWNMSDRSVHALDVTQRYRRAAAHESDAEQTVAVRLWSSRGGLRLAADAVLIAEDERHHSTTFADPDDINRVAQFPYHVGRQQRIELTVDDETRLWLDTSQQPSGVIELYWDELALSQASADRLAERIWQEYVATHHDERKAELDALIIRDGEDEMRLLRRDFGERPDAGHSLWISMHGGGGAPAHINDQQWRNQIRLYEPAEGIYIAPRAPSNEWNLWHRPEIDRLFDRLIESAIVVWGIDPDRVFLLGYSAGGDGVYQLAPRMADRFAAASMMAGHPNDSTPLGLRNLPFAIYMGANDAAYNRNRVAEEWRTLLEILHRDDPEGYPHKVRIYDGLGHWMNGRDAEALPWMSEFSRSPWPNRVVWRQGNVPHTRFYWLSVNEENAVRGRTIIAAVNGRTIEMESNDVNRIELLLHDELLDLDKPIRVKANGEIVFEGAVRRTEEAMRRSLNLRADRRMIATARLVVEWPTSLPDKAGE